MDAGVVVVVNGGASLCWILSTFNTYCGCIILEGGTYGQFMRGHER